MHFEKNEVNNSAEIRVTCFASLCNKQCNGAEGNAAKSVMLGLNS